MAVPGAEGPVWLVEDLVTLDLSARGIDEAFYAWQAAGEGPTEREWDEALSIHQIRALHAASNGTCGEPPMTAELEEGAQPQTHRPADASRDGGGIVRAGAGH